MTDEEYIEQEYKITPFQGELLRRRLAVARFLAGRYVHIGLPVRAAVTLSRPIAAVWMYFKSMTKELSDVGIKK